MGEPVGFNKALVSGVSCYLYGKIIQETCFSCYSANLAIAELVKMRIYT